MQLHLSQAPLSKRIPALVDSIRSIRAQRDALDTQEEEMLELLRQAEQELKGHPAGSEDTQPSGLLSEATAEKPAPVKEPLQATKVQKAKKES